MIRGRKNWAEDHRKDFILIPGAIYWMRHFTEDPATQALVSDTVKRLNFAYISAVKRFTLQSKCTPEDINNALMEYFSIDKGPFSL